jgi:hypothetical protein
LIEFSSLYQGLNYYINCPLCKGNIIINTRDLVDDYRYVEYAQSKNVISFFLDSYTEDIISININTEEVRLDISSMSNRNKYHGLFLHGLSLECEDCASFSYTLQLHINLHDLYLSRILLNSESICIEDNDKLHEIRNIYSIGKTEYNYYLGPSKFKEVSLPVIKINYDNLKDTVDRINKLMVFS